MVNEEYSTIETIREANNAISLIIDYLLEMGEHPENLMEFKMAVSSLQLHGWFLIKEAKSSSPENLDECKKLFLRVVDSFLSCVDAVRLSLKQSKETIQ